MTEYRTVLERAGRRAPTPDLPFERVLRRRDRKRRNQRIAAGTVGFAVFLAAIALLALWPVDRTVTPGGGGTATGPTVTEPTVAPEAAGIVGLPAPGAPPSTPEHGRLVLSVSGTLNSLWVYADGRMIWGEDLGNVPEGAPTAGATGFVEQHFTPAGVEFLRTQVLSTGLFEHDLALQRDWSGFLTIQVRNGDRLVSLNWAVGWDVVKDAPSATPEQASALQGIYALIADPTSWPAYAWENQDVDTYVPSHYQVWLRVYGDGDGPNVTVGEREVALLPAPARSILDLGTKVDQAFTNRLAGYELTTDQTRALAEALNHAGLEPWAMPMGEAAVRYELEDPYEPGNSLWVFFGPVLPHGEAIFLGPG